MGNVGAATAVIRVVSLSVTGVGKTVGVCFDGGVSGNVPGGAPTELGSGDFLRTSSVRVARTCPVLSKRLVTTCSF